MSPGEVKTDLGYITGGIRQFWAVGGPGGASGATEGLIGFQNGTTGGIGVHTTRDAKERERERTQRPQSSFEPTPGSHFRSLVMNAFVNEEAIVPPISPTPLETTSSFTVVLEMPVAQGGCGCKNRDSGLELTL